ncbi:putative reverse transcriptase domain-containing protein, partial [Tanacetum coccineum]
HHQMETEARLSREAWRRLMDASDLARGEVMSLRTTVLGQMSEIRELHAADHMRQAVILEVLKADQRRSAEMRELRTTDRTRQQQLIQTLTVMIDQGVTSALAARDANMNGDDSHTSGQKPTCFECGVQGHFKRECPKLKNNKNRGNQFGNDRAPAKVYVVGHARTNPDSNIVTGTFLLNNRYASILFDTGADRSFVSTAFSSQMDITPSTLDHYYDVELADGRIIGLNTILRGCTLNLLNHPFNINLMPVELGSFDAIIGMD